MTDTSKVNVRALALEVLLKVLEEGEYSSGAIQNVLRTYQYLDKNQRAFFTRLCEGTIERALELDYIIEQHSTVKVNKMKPVIRNLLRMGVYQLKYMEHVPVSAACNEAVKLAQKKGFFKLKGFVNGVLRNISRNLGEISYPCKEKQPIQYLSVTYSMPMWIVEKWVSEYGMDTTELMLKASMDEKATSIRCNTQKNSVKQLKETLEKEGVTVSEGKYIKEALYIKNYNYLGALQSFRQGLFTVQDESSMFVGMVSGIEKGNMVLDVCSAPGGKTFHAAQLLKGTGLVSARDVSQRKIDLVNENKQRLCFENVETKVWDATILDEDYVGKADVLIADLPCSGLGVIGKKNDIKYKMKEESLQELVLLQREILKVVTHYIKKGGTMIFSTCTVNLQENQENVRWIEENTSLVLESIDSYLPEELHNEDTKKGYLQLIPGIHGTDGFFLARFRKQ